MHKDRNICSGIFANQTYVSCKPHNCLFFWERKLGGGFKCFCFHPYLGKIPILTNIFQVGWNHQLENIWETKKHDSHSRTFFCWKLFLFSLWATIFFKNPWTLQREGLNLYSAEVFLGPQNRQAFEGSGFLQGGPLPVTSGVISPMGYNPTYRGDFNPI